MKKAFLCAILVACCMMHTAWGQVCLRGKVVDENNRPISGANIRVSESLCGTTTDVDGQFNLILSDGAHCLRVTYLGYTQATYEVNHSMDNILIRLKEKFININQVVVTGTGSHRRMSDSPIPIKVLTGKDLHEANVTDFQDAMTKLNPSIVFMENGQGVTMNMNGLTEKYVVVLENGKRLAGDDAYARINMSNIKRVEILNGAASALYGSDAIAGVINIITDDVQNKVNVLSNSRYASKNQFEQSATADVNVGKFASYTSYQYQRADGWQLSPFVESKGELVRTNKQASEGFHKHVISQRFIFDATDRLSFYLRGSLYVRKTDRPMPMDIVNTTNYNLRKETFTYGTGVQYMINKCAYLNADYTSDNYSTYKDFFEGKRNGATDITKRVHFHDLNVKGIFRLGKFNKLSAGSEFIREMLNSQTDHIQGKKVYSLAFYLQDEININKHFQSYVGLRYIYHEQFKSFAIPNVALLYKVGNFNFRGSYSSGFRSPDLKELFTESEKKSAGATRLTIGNPNLDPEKSDNYTLNVEYSMRTLSISVSAFMNNVRDMINYKTLETKERDVYNVVHGTDFDEIQMRANIDKAKIKGFNVSLNAYLGAGFSVNSAYSFIDGKNVREKELLDKSVKHSGTLAVAWTHMWNKYRLNVNFNGRIQGERYSVSYGYAPRFSLWNINTSHIFRLRNFLLEPSVGIENLFDYVDDRPFNNNYATLTPGRTCYVSLLLRFKR